MTYREAMLQAERAYWLKMLNAHDWNYVRTAQAAGICRQHLYGMLRRVGISRESQLRAA